MTYEEALELADEEIRYIRVHNKYKTDKIEEIYHSTKGSLVDSEEKFRKLFAEYFFIKDTPLYQAMREEDDSQV